MDVLEFDGKRYVKASTAAREAGYTSDYIGQLCRSGAIDAHLVGRSWYVDTAGLTSHRIEKKRSSRVKAREQVRRVLAVQQEGDAATRKISKHAPISYENDERELVPEIKKLSITEDKRTSVHVKKSKIPTFVEAYEIEREGQKVIMKGSLDIVDVTDDTFDDYTRDATILVPKLIKRAPDAKDKKAHPHKLSSAEEIQKIQQQVVEKPEEIISSDETATEVAVPTTKAPLTFADRLKLKDASIEKDIPDIIPARSQKQQGNGTSPFVWVPVLLCSIILSCFGICMPILFANWHYTQAESNAALSPIEVQYGLDVDPILETIDFKTWTSRVLEKVGSVSNKIKN